MCDTNLAHVVHRAGVLTVAEADVLIMTPGEAAILGVKKRSLFGVEVQAHSARLQAMKRDRYTCVKCFKPIEYFAVEKYKGRDNYQLTAYYTLDGAEQCVVAPRKDIGVTRKDVGNLYTCCETCQEEKIHA